MNSTSSTAPFNSATTDDKTTAIVSYLTLIGFVAAVVMHGSKKTRLGSFHLRQSLGLTLTSIAIAFGAAILAFVPFIGWLVGLATWFGLLALWVIGLLSAINGEQKPVPVLGEHFQKWFGSAFDYSAPSSSRLPFAQPPPWGGRSCIGIPLYHTSAGGSLKAGAKSRGTANALRLDIHHVTTHPWRSACSDPVAPRADHSFVHALLRF